MWSVLVRSEPVRCSDCFSGKHSCLVGGENNQHISHYQQGKEKRWRDSVWAGDCCESVHVMVMVHVCMMVNMSDGDDR